MFTIQYVKTNGTHGMQDLDSRDKNRLVRHLSTYQRPIVAVYEGTTPVTREAAKRLREWKGTLSREARNFAFATTPA
jgi:hypothetical protein